MMFLCILEHLINVLIYQKLLKQIFHNKRHPTQYTSKSTSEILDFLSDVHKVKYKERKSPIKSAINTSAKGHVPHAIDY